MVLQSIKTHLASFHSISIHGFMRIHIQLNMLEAWLTAIPAVFCIESGREREREQENSINSALFSLNNCLKYLL